jgi:hypothetical protein
LKRIIPGLFALILTVSLILAVNPSFALAWDQTVPDFETHQQINNQALALFYDTYYVSDAKYLDGKIDAIRLYLGPKVVSCGLTIPDHSVKGETQTFEEWVNHGGYSADEPHFWASVRHFYDPLKVNGSAELTDQEAGHDKFYDAVSAYDWTFRDERNPFSWKKALEYYKRAMEIAEDSKISVIPGSDFRDPALTVTSPAQAREVYLAKSFRSLGETMHMMADLTQPAHVRNDSHPFFDTDPLEALVTKSHVVTYMNYPVDPRIGAKIDTPFDAATMYEEMAKYTNENFYSNDTIYDAAANVNPINMEKPYPHPQFKDLDWHKATRSYSENFTGEPVPMIQQDFISYWIGINSSLGMARSYSIPTEYADAQAKVLLPIAIKADSKLIELFFPTLELSMDVKENKDNDQGSDSNYKEFLVTGEMKHLLDKDLDWDKQNRKIQYCGPAELWCERKGKAMRIGDVEFSEGLIKEPLIVYAGIAPKPTTAEKLKKYQVQDGDSVYLVINAGGRIFNSNKFPIVVESKITTGKWVLDSESSDEGAVDKDIKSEIKQGSAVYSKYYPATEYRPTLTTKVNFTFTEAPRELVPGSKVKFTVSGESFSTWSASPVRFSILSMDIYDYEKSQIFGSFVVIDDTHKKVVMTNSATIPEKNEGNKGKLRFEYHLSPDEGGSRKVTYNYIYK